MITKDIKHSDVISTIFFSSAVAMIFTQLAGYGAALIDGIITSRTLGSQAYSAISLLGPFNGVILLLSGSVSIGCQVVSSQAVGTGDRDKANSAFSLALIMAAVLSVILVTAGILVPNQLFSICGVSIAKHPQLHAQMLSYLNGYMYGIPLMMLIQVIGPIIVMDSGKFLFTVSAFSMSIFNIAGDLMNGLFFNGGNFGMGLATSLAYLLQFVILLFHFIKRSHYFSFSIASIARGQLLPIMKAASPTFVMKFAVALRDLLINRINLAVALSTAAVAARGMQNDLNTVLFCIGLGIGKTLVTMTGIYYGAEDRKGITRLFSYSMKLSAVISGTVGLLAFIFAPVIAGFFSSESEVVELASFSIRCMALGLVPDTVLAAFSNYLQGINNRKLLNFLNIGDRFLFPVACAYILGMIFGSKGIMASVAVGKFALLLLMTAGIYFKTGHLPKSVNDFMFLDENFGGADSDNIYASISNIDDVARESINAEKFCLSHGISSRKAKLMSLFVEEMAGNIVQHGTTKRGRKAGVDYRLSVNGGNLCLTLRDCYEHFDPVAFYNAHNYNNDRDGDMLGIRIVMKLSKETRYFNAFNSNSIIIYIDNETEATNEDLH